MNNEYLLDLQMGYWLVFSDSESLLNILISGVWATFYLSLLLSSNFVKFSVLSQSLGSIEAFSKVEFVLLGRSWVSFNLIKYSNQHVKNNAWVASGGLLPVVFLVNRLTLLSFYICSRTSNRQIEIFWRGTSFLNIERTILGHLRD